jgi:Sulfotransferase domain
MGTIGRIFVGIRYLAGQDPPRRRLIVDKDDTFLVSYPKSGNTWVRLLLANLVHPEEAVTLTGADRIIPSVDGQSRRYFEQMPRPRLIKSHYPFCQTYKRVIYVVRDPRDIAVSQYYFQIKRRVLEEGFPVDKFISSFVAGEVCPYGSWGENVASWMGARNGDPNFLIIRYEDLLRRTQAELYRIAALLQMDVTPERLALAVERSTAKQMRKMEKQEWHLWASTKNTRQDISFIRAATDGQWQSVLSSSSVRKIEAAWGHLMLIFGYKLAYVQVEKEKSLRISNLLPALSSDMRGAAMPAQVAM